MMLQLSQLKELLEIMEREGYDAILISTQIFYRRDGKWYDGKGHKRIQL